MKYTRGERTILWITNHTPHWILDQPERIILNIILFFVGLAVISPPADNAALQIFPDYLRYILGALFIVGSVASIYGTTTFRRRADRYGSLILTGASFFLAMALFGAVGLRSLITGIVFLGIAFAKFFRFLRATAVRIRIRHHLLEMAESVRK